MDKSKGEPIDAAIKAAELEIATNYLRGRLECKAPIGLFVQQAISKILQNIWALAAKAQAMRDVPNEFERKLYEAIEDVRCCTPEREASCPICNHEWRRHDPEDGKCDAGPPCFCGRDLAKMQERIATLSRDNLGNE